MFPEQFSVCSLINLKTLVTNFLLPIIKAFIELPFLVPIQLLSFLHLYAKIKNKHTLTSKNAQITLKINVNWL